MKTIYILILLTVYLFSSSCTNNDDNHYREIQTNRELSEMRDFILSETQSKYYEFDSRRAAIIAQKGNTSLVDYWMNKALKVTVWADSLYNYIETEQNKLLNGESYTSWKDLSTLNNLNDKHQVSNLFLATTNGQTKGIILKDSLKVYLENLLETALNYRVGSKEYRFELSERLTNKKLGFEDANPVDTTWASKLITKYSDILEDDKSERWDELQFYDATIIEGLNVLQRLKNLVRFSELNVVDFMLDKSQTLSCGFTRIAEYRAIGEAKTIRRGEDMEVEIQIILESDSDEFHLLYGLNETNENNWKPATGKFNVKGEKVGVNKVFGKVRTSREGEYHWVPFEYEFTVLE